MEHLVEQLRHYVAETLDFELRPSVWGDDGKLPFILQDTYQFRTCKLLDAPCLMMLARDGDGPTPASVRKHQDMLRKHWDGAIVYVCARMSAYNRQRFIQQKVPFIVPGNQMYLPSLGLDLREHFRTRRQPEPQTLGPSAQALLIYCLLNGKHELAGSAELAQQLGYSAMTMGRAFDELEAANLGEGFKQGRERCLKLVAGGEDLWERAQPLLRSPVRQLHHVRWNAPPDACPLAGLSALSRYSMLAEPADPIYATTRREWKRIRHADGVTPVPYAEPGTVEIEVWSYDPNLFAENGIVDRLSLCLALQEESDERVEGALDEMMEAMRW